MNRDELRQYLTFYRDLGVKEIYKRGVTLKPSPAASAVEPTPAGDCRPSRPRATRSSKSVKTSAIAAAAGCARHAAKIVFGSGNEHARLVFVGEGPGADEDAQGFPFVGRAGQLLTQMIDNTASKEGIPIKPAGCLHLQRREMPPSGKSHAAAG